MKLLFVEDEYYTRCGILQSVDWHSLGIDEIQSASNGQEGLQKLSTHPDILLTDIRMPYISGLDIAKQLKRDDPDSEVIILSSYSDKEYLFTAISLSAVSYIEKPVQLDVLIQALRQAVSRRKQFLMLRRLTQQPSFTTLPDPDTPSFRHSTRMVLQLIAQQYHDEQLSVNQLAEAVHLTAEHLTTNFKEDTGRTIKRVLTDVRIEAAQHLLMTTNRSVGEIARQVGYGNANYFSKLFRQETGTAPNEYRAQQVHQEERP